MKKKRILWADSLKGWLMILVIVGHTIQTIMGDGCFDDHVFNLIYSFHMPAFMAVSGWFAFRCDRIKGGGITVCRRSYQLLVPYFIWSLLQWVMGGCSIAELSKIILNPDTYFWFLWVLFWVCIIFTLCQWVADKLNIDEFVTIALSCMILMGIMVGLEFRVFGFQFLAYYFLFYTLGYSVHRFSILQIKNNMALLSLGLFWLFMAWFWKMHELPSWMPAIPHVPSTLLQYAYRGLTAAVAMLVLFGLAPKLLDGNTRFNTWIKNLGVVSLGLYVVHLSIMGYIAYIIKTIIPSCPVWGLICLVFVVTFIFSVIIVELLNKYKWTAKYLLGKV